MDSQTDAAYGYVQTANEKEQRNQIRREKRKQQKPRFWPSLIVATIAFLLAASFAFEAKWISAAVWFANTLLWSRFAWGAWKEMPLSAH